MSSSSTSVKMPLEKALLFPNHESRPKTWFVHKEPKRPTERDEWISHTRSTLAAVIHAIKYLCNRFPSYSEQQADRLLSPCLLNDPTIRLLTSISPKPRPRETNQPPTSSPYSLHAAFFFLRFSLWSMSKTGFDPRYVLAEFYSRLCDLLCISHDDLSIDLRLETSISMQRTMQHKQKYFFKCELELTRPVSIFHSCL